MEHRFTGGLAATAAAFLVAGCMSAPPAPPAAPTTPSAQAVAAPAAQSGASALSYGAVTSQVVKDKTTQADLLQLFDKSFDRTFDSMIIALANLGCRVNNMERVSGYITSSLPELPPELSEQLKKQALSEYARAKGYPPSVVESNSPINVNMAGAMTERMTAGVTLTMTRQGSEQTKVKLRFNNVYYPRTVEELYKRVWDAVDKQIFLDRTVG